MPSDKHPQAVLFPLRFQLMPTPCHRDGCDNHAHVIVFAAGFLFLAQPTTPGHPIYLCLTCGGQLYDVIREWRRNRSVSTPAWLVDDLKADRLPTIQPTDWTQTRRARARRQHPTRGRK